MRTVTIYSAAFEIKCVKSPDDEQVYFCGSGKKAQSGDSGIFYSPVREPIYTALFHIYPDTLDAHRGIDVIGTSDILAAADGEVVESCAGSCSGSYGQYVILQHENGLYTLYAHMSQVFVAYGEKVTRANQTSGTVLGIMGNTGYSFGTHLHFEVRSHQSHDYVHRLDPLQYIRINISECSNIFGVVDALTSADGVYLKWYSLDQNGNIFVK